MKLRNVLVLAFFNWTMMAQAASDLAWVQQECGALLGAFVVEDLAGPHGNDFLLGYKLSRAIQNPPPSLEEFFDSDQNELCLYNCVTQDADVTVNFRRRSSHRVVRGYYHTVEAVDYIHRFKETDPIFEAVTVQLTEQTLPSTEPRASEFAIHQDFESAESNLRTYLIRMLNPWALQAIGTWIGQGITVEKGQFYREYDQENSKRELNAIRTNNADSLILGMLLYPSDTLGRIVYTYNKHFDFEMDPKAESLKISGDSTVIFLQFADSGKRLAGLSVSTTSTQALASVEIEFNKPTLSSIVQRYEHLKKTYEKARVAEEIAAIMQRAVEMDASEGQYSERDDEHGGVTVVFEVNPTAKATNEGLEFLMADDPRPKIFVIRGKEYHVSYMRDGHIVLETEEQEAPISGSYLRRTVKRVGRDLRMIDVVLNLRLD